MRITDEGEVRLPPDVRERTGLLPGTEVDLVVEGDGVKIVRSAEAPVGETRGERAVRLLRGSGSWPAGSTDEIMKLLRGE